MSVRVGLNDVALTTEWANATGFPPNKPVEPGFDPIGAYAHAY